MRDGEWREWDGYRINRDFDKPKKSLKDVLTRISGIRGTFDGGLIPDLKSALAKAHEYYSERRVAFPVQREGLRRETQRFPLIQDAVDQWARKIEHCQQGLAIIEEEQSRLGN